MSIETKTRMKVMKTRALACAVQKTAQLGYRAVMKLCWWIMPDQMIRRAICTCQVEGRARYGQRSWVGVALARAVNGPHAFCQSCCRGVVAGSMMDQDGPHLPRTGPLPSADQLPDELRFDDDEGHESIRWQAADWRGHLYVARHKGFVARIVRQDLRGSSLADVLAYILWGDCARRRRWTWSVGASDHDSADGAAAIRQEEFLGVVKDGPLGQAIERAEAALRLLVRWRDAERQRGSSADNV